ncbi:MAG: T9SS type A sorting domain-containing protein, partial [bacterium]
LDRDTKLQRITLLHGDALGESVPAARGGGGLLLYDSSPKLEDLRFVGCNSLDGGGGLRVVGGYDDQRIELSGCAFIYCWSGGRGGGIEMIGLGSAEVKRNTFAGNFSESRGGALAVVGFPATVTKNVWWRNCAHEKAGSLWCEDADADAECNIFWENIPEIGEGDLECEVRIGGGDEPNTIADPLFCDFQAENFAIDADSPASPKHSDECGLIGAYGPACGIRPRHVTRLTEPAPEAGALRVQVSPNPTVEAARVSVDGDRAGEATAEIFDLAGRRVQRLPGTGGLFVWDGRDATGRRAVAGIYFARVAAGPETVVARVVVLER